jgi:serine/threonine protein kinase
MVLTMSSAGKFCCFRCPENDFDIKSIEQPCPKCGRPYNYELKNTPEEIGDFRILSPLGRGFYGATFVAEKKGLIARKYVLKVIPKAVYSFFKKSFEEECQTHSKTAQGADFIVDIVDAFDSTATFGDHPIDVHVAVLEYLDGKPLQKYLQGPANLTPGRIAQIACDLIKISHELRVRGQNHNDFHSGNILVEELTKERSRDGALDPSVRAVAIDLGSTSGDRRSGDGYKSDLHWIAEHIRILSEKTFRNTDQFTDLDARVSLALQDVSASFSAPVEAQRVPNADELIRSIENAFYRSAEPWRPWREQLTFRRYAESFNAQTLAPWHVPQLLVDPDGDWQKRASSKGPLIVTGMRGCGKTMLLRSLEFHARARQGSEESNSGVIQRLTADGFVGFFVSAQVLLDESSDSSMPKERLFARLAVAYALEATRALAHLKDIDETQIEARSPSFLTETLRQLLTDFEIDTRISSIEQLEHTLIRKLLEVSRHDNSCKLAMHPSKAFPALAKAIVACSKLWRSARVLFLLDDVSTRYLDPEKIEEILSSIIFQTTDQSVDCSFKLTSETQTIFLSLKSLGGVEQAAHWRDFETFDLGAEVYKRLKNKGGKEFITKILAQRAEYFPGHPKAGPLTIMGDKTLNSIAQSICLSKPSSANRKSVYSGLSALKAVCVGDIGSAISIYESILQKGETQFPVAPDLQSEIFQDHCSRHLYVLDRRGSALKSAAKSFASASFRALVDSHRKGEVRGLRQYTSIYVRVSAEDEADQSKYIRELVDAGVFVFHGGTPRTKTHDSDPVQQFKLVFRKIYGLADFMPLADRDRFELSGADLTEWLTNPGAGADLLCRNLGETGDEELDENDDEDLPDGENSDDLADTQETPVVQAEFDFPGKQAPLGTMEIVSSFKLPKVEEVTKKCAKDAEGCELVIGLGFEECCEVSAIQAISLLKPKRIHCVRYGLPGRSEAILEFAKMSGAEVVIHASEDPNGLQPKIFNENVFVDISGLSKPQIFKSITGALRQSGEVHVCYSAPKTTWPNDEALSMVLDAEKQLGETSVVEELKKIVASEFPPYHTICVESLESDATRARALLAFASSSHERLIHLVSDQSFNHLDVLTKSGIDSAARVAEMVAHVAAREAETHDIIRQDFDNPNAILGDIEKSYRKKYFTGGMNFEIGLTGSKLDTLAAAVFCSKYRANKIWYVRPDKFDINRFSSGVKKQRYFKITL